MNHYDPEVLTLRATVEAQQEELHSIHNELRLMRDGAYQEWLDRFNHQAEIARVQLDLFPNDRAH
jgi:hypothetical protein